MTNNETALRDGAQTVDRTVLILKTLSANAEAGLRLVDLQRDTGLSKPTIHRILVSLMRHGFVSQDQPSKRYRLGHELAILGWSVTRTNYDLRELCQHEMRVLAEETGDTAFLTVRSGIDSVCIDRKMGPYPIKAFTVDVGTRRPLPVGAGGIAIIASLHENEAETIYRSNRDRLKPYPNITERAVRKAVIEAKANGYAVSNGFVLREVRGLAIPIQNTLGEPVGAISIAALRDRISTGRLPALLGILRRQASSIEKRIARIESGQ